MSNNDNYNHNEHDGSDNNNQSSSHVHGGELKNGRLSQIKNYNSLDDQVPNEYRSEKEPPNVEDYNGFEMDQDHMETP